MPRAQCQKVFFLICFWNIQEQVRNYEKYLLDNNIILNNLIKSTRKCYSKTNPFHLRNIKSGKKQFLEIWMRMQNMSVIYDTNRLMLIVEKNFTGKFKSHLWRSLPKCSENFIEINLSVKLAWNLWLFFQRLQ